MMMMMMMIWETYFENCYQTNNYQFHCRVNIFIIYNFLVLNIIHCPPFYLKHNVSETALCVRLHVKNYSIGPPIVRASLRNVVF
jgi:hypothetical protein